MTLEQKCLIWGTDATVRSEDYDFHFHVNSVRAGGKYQIKKPSKDRLSNILTSDPTKAEHFKLVLSNWILEQNQFGNIPVITEDILEAAKTWKNLSVFQRANKLLLWLNKKSDRLGDVFKLFFPEEDCNEDLKLIDDLKCWTASEQLSEIMTLIEYCHEQKWLELRSDITDRLYTLNNTQYLLKKHQIMLLPHGYAKVDKINNKPNQLSSQAFVAMWFAPEMDEPYTNGIMKAIQDCGYKPVNIGQKDHINKICDEIIAEIRRSKFVVADLTARTIEHEKEKIHEARGGVYYEAGFAQGLNIPVIWTCRKDIMDDQFVHFDIRQYNTIVWEDSADLYTQLKQRIGAVIGEAT